MYYTVIKASKDQIDKLINKHLSPYTIFKISPVTSYKYSYDTEDGIGYVTLNLIRGKKAYYQLRGDEPLFVEFTGFGVVRYDVHYPHQYPKLYNILKKHGLIAKNKFWKGADI